MRNGNSTPTLKHRIIFIPHSLNRVWRNLLLLDVVLWVTFWFAPYTNSFFSPPLRDLYLLYAAVLCLGLMLLFFLIRNWGSVQAREDHVRVVVPFYRLKIPYDLIKDVRMTEFRKIFDFKTLSWANKRFLRYYRKKVVATLHLKYYPKSLGMRIFIPKYFFLPKEAGFLFLIKDYMTFNTQVDSRLNIQDGTFSTVQEEQESTVGVLDLFSE